MSSSFALFLLNLSYAGRFKEVDVVKEKGLDFASHLNFNIAHILLSRIINLNLILIEMSVLYPFFLAIFRFKDEPQVTKYVKIASTLPDKSVRDVAMRCKWMTVSLVTPFSLSLSLTVYVSGLHSSCYCPFTCQLKEPKIQQL